jgi:hypothetical protein
MENETKATKKMTIARALKEKERAARKLRAARETLSRVNSVLMGEKRPVDAQEAFETVQCLQNRYLEIKKAIAVANAGISAQLTEMLVVRAEKEYYEKLDCKEASSHGEWETAADGSRVWRTAPYDAYINEGKRQEIVAALEQRLDDLQDEVDAFNATHSVEIVV